MTRSSWKISVEGDGKESRAERTCKRADGSHSTLILHDDAHNASVRIVADAPVETLLADLDRAEGGGDGGDPRQSLEDRRWRGGLVGCLEREGERGSAASFTGHHGH